MSNFSGEDELDIVLSDGDDDYNLSPATMKFESSLEKFSELLAELEHEKQARVIAEDSNAELQVSFNRLKALAHEAIMRDEALKVSSLLNNRLETQSKELSRRQHLIDDLELIQREANENIQGLKMRIAAGEKEITRWRGIAEEAAARSTVEREYLTLIDSYKQEIEETKQTMLELVKKLKFKEETAENSFSSDIDSNEKLSELLAELESEKQARVIAENSKSELQVSFNRLKALAHEAIKKRDEWGRARYEALEESRLLNNRIEELELREREANENIQELKMEIVAAEEEITRSRGIVEEEAAARNTDEQEYLTQIQGLNMSIATAEEEITRWRGIAEEEAAARTAVEQEYLTQLASYMKEIEEIKRTRFELMRKLKFKDEIAGIY